MRLKKVFSAIFGSLLLTLGVVNIVRAPEKVVNATDSTVTYTVTSTSAVSTSGTAPTGSSVSYSSTYTSKCQLTKDNYMVLTLQNFEGYVITGLTLSMRSNKSSGGGSMSLIAGTTTLSSISTAAFNTASWNGAWSTEYVDVSPSMSNDKYVVDEDEDVTLTITASASSIYCQSITLTYVQAKTVTFNSNGGSSVDSKKVKSGQKVAAPSNPTKVGYSFDGWYTDNGTFASPYDFNTLVSNDLTLYAKWNENSTYYTVSFETNSGSLVDSQSIVAGGLVLEPSNPTRTDYTFQGWYKEAGFANLWNFASDTVSTDTTLYAKWTLTAFLNFLDDLDAVDAHMSLAYRYHYQYGDKNLITDASSLQPGDKVMIVASGYNYAMGAQSGNNCPQVQISKDGNSIVAPTNKNVAYFTLEAGSEDDTWAFKDEGSDKYLYAASKSSNHLKLQDVKDANASFSISITDGVATIVAQGTNTHNILQYNSSNGLFSCYASAQKDVSLYTFNADAYSDVDFRIRCGVDNLIDTVAAELDDTTYGIEVKTSTKTVKYYSNNALYDDSTDPNIAFVVIDLKDVLGNISRASEEFTVRAFVNYSGDFYYSASEKTYSVAGLVNEYYTGLDAEVVTAVTPLYNVLTALGVSF